MARIRSIKPEITSDARLARLSRETRYHFVLLWTQADDAGCFRATPRLLLGQMYPHDRDIGEAKVDEMTAELAAAGFIDVRTTPDGPIGKVRNWAKHQKIDRPSKSHLEPQFASASRVSRETPSQGVLSPDLGVLSPDLSSSPGDSRKGWQPARELHVAVQLPTQAGKDALAALLHVGQTDVGKTGIIAQVELMLAGERGEPHLTHDQLDQLLRDYATNGFSSGRFNAAHFRACAARLLRPAEPVPLRPLRQNAGAQQVQNILGVRTGTHD